MPSSASEAGRTGSPPASAPSDGDDEEQLLGLKGDQAEQPDWHPERERSVEPPLQLHRHLPLSLPLHRGPLLVPYHHLVE